MPSPTIATRRPAAWRSSTARPCQPGRTSARTRSGEMPTRRATASASRARSPVTSQTSIPASVSAATASAASGRTGSARAIRPAGRPSTATRTAVGRPSAARPTRRPGPRQGHVRAPRGARPALPGAPRADPSPDRRLDTAPGDAPRSRSPAANPSSRSRAAARMAAPSGCSLPRSSERGQRRASSVGVEARQRDESTTAGSAERSACRSCRRRRCRSGSPSPARRRHG